MIIYKTLENTDIKIIHETFLEAFSDYEIKFDISLTDFKNMMYMKDYNSELSIGAFENNKLVGFILNGFRNWNNKSTIYDIGTAVVPEFRKQGITTNIFLNIKRIATEKNIDQYLLEVLKTNESAFKLYKKQNFKVFRKFLCFQTNNFQVNINNFSSKYKFEILGSFEEDTWNKIAEFWDFNPSWQNAVKTIKNKTDEFSYLLVKSDNEIIGYGIINKITGTIAQLAVHKDYRREKIGTNIINFLFENTKSSNLRILNLDETYDYIKKFFIKLGFENTVGQYEMTLDLD